MRTILTLGALLCCLTYGFTQSPEKMSYQAVIRNTNGELVSNQTVGMQISIVQGSANGSAVYVETHSPATNENGLVSLEIGNGNASMGKFSTIDWSAGPYFIQTETDPSGGSNYSITGTSQLLSVPYALYAKTAGSMAEEDQKPKTYKVGEFAQGGVIFWIDETGQHGLVVAKIDQSSEVRWYAGTYGSTRATGDGIFAGESNTILIISTQLTIGDDRAEYAAQICNDLKITEGGQTYGDWYLPSKEELDLMYENKEIIEVMAKENGGEAFANLYWSSTEWNDELYAWCQSFSTGGQIVNLKARTSGMAVRAIRAF